MKLLAQFLMRLNMRWTSVCAALLLALAPLSWAAGSPSGKLIKNVASVDFVIGSSPLTTSYSNATLFVVDKKVDLLVTEAAGSVTYVIAGQTQAVTTFQVMNQGNDAQGIKLNAAVALGDPANNGTAPFTTNNFNATGLTAYVDANSNGIYEPAIDTQTFIPSLNADASQTVFVVGNIPSTTTIGQQSVVSLTATATVPASGATLTQTNILDTPMSVDTVFADAAGVVENARDAAHSAYGAYLVSVADVAISKTIVDATPAGGSTVTNPPSGDPSLRPGTTLTYRITASFVGSGTISNLVISDPLPANTTYVTNSTTVNSIAQTDIADADQTVFASGALSITLGSVTTSTINPAAPVVIQFKATIN